MKNKEYHIPVLLNPSVEGLVTNPDGIYIDLTFGGGGHSRAIVDRLSAKGCLCAFDQDEDAIANAFTDRRLHLYKANFRYFGQFLKYEGIKKVDGIFADLGVSSWQFDSDKRGFSFRFDQKLDMRMNEHSTRTAAEILNNYSQQDLVSIFSEYGEVRNSKSLARKIVELRELELWQTTRQFNQCLERMRIGEIKKYFAQVYQALRIEVNDEMGALKQMLEESEKWLKVGGRLVMLTYHSIEDRYVKRFLKTGNFTGEQIKDDFGNIRRPFGKVGKQIILPDQQEIKENPRSRSAKLRVVEKK